MEKLTPPEQLAYDEGLEKSLETIENLLSFEDNILVLVAGPIHHDTQIGKTRFSYDLTQKLEEKNIPFILGSSFDGLLQGQPTQGRNIILLSAESFGYQNMNAEQSERFKNNQDKQAENLGKKLDLPIKGVNLRIFIYRPDLPGTETDNPLADIVISNEKAKDRPGNV